LVSHLVYKKLATWQTCCSSRGFVAAKWALEAGASLTGMRSE
jgi:hypothetical protein